MRETTGSSTKECPFCIAEIPREASRCRYCTGDLSPTADTPNLSGFWGAGIVIVLVGVVIAAASAGDGSGWGFFIAAVGGVFLEIAVIASAVSIGMRHRDERAHVARYANAERRLELRDDPA